MTQHHRPEPFFIADDTALDFLNSVCTPANEEFEWLASGEDLLDWLLRATLIDSAGAADFPAEEMNAAAKEAREFREKFRAVVANNVGRDAPALEEKFIDDLNALLSRGSDKLEFQRNSAPPPSHLLARRWRLQRASDLLAPLATAAARLLASPDFSAVKQCEGPACTLWFRDVSKNQRRRWCTMSICGNRAKAAAFRQRRQQEG